MAAAGNEGTSHSPAAESHRSSSSEDEKLSPSLSSAADKKPKKEVRRKRRAPLVPYKKPKGFPKRPLSAYNLFFQCERERILNASRPASDSPAKSSDTARKDVADASKVRTMISIEPSFENQKGNSSDSSIDDDKRKKRRHLKTSGIGFANLTKTIAAKWKVLDPETRSRFEVQAAKEKESYKKAVQAWRNKKQESSEDQEDSAKEEAIKEIESVPQQPEPANIQPDNNERQTSSKPEPNRSELAETPPATISMSVEQDFHERTIRMEDDFAMSTSGLDGRNLESALALEDVSPVEIMAAEHQNSSSKTDNAENSIVQSSLAVLGSHLDDETADFLTNLKYD